MTFPLLNSTRKIKLFTFMRIVQGLFHNIVEALKIPLKMLITRRNSREKRKINSKLIC